MKPSVTCISGILGLALVLGGCGHKDKEVPLVEKNPDSAAQATKEAVVKTAGKGVEKDDVIPEEYTRAGATAPEKMTFARIEPTEGNATSGYVVFIQPTAKEEKLRVVGKIINIAAGMHGFHIHETGNCMSPDASTAGAHLNPVSTMHGDREAPMRHVGDLGNLEASADQTATFDFYDSQISFNGVNSIIGKAFIIHASPDDLFSQPSGNSGSRIACGVIEN